MPVNTNPSRDLAIKRHDIDAGFFQKTYEKSLVVKKTYPFLEGRKLVLEDFDTLLGTLPKNAKILDVGCGTGHLTKSIKDKGFDVTGMEPSANMIAFARKNFPDITFTEGISVAIPFADQSFDAIICFEVLRYMDESETLKTYQEFQRILKPGGVFLATHVNRYSTDWYYLFYHIKGVAYKLLKKTYHFCYFTTASEQTSILKEWVLKILKPLAIWWAL